MVSIICATYNMADYIQRCIDSLLAQTYKDIEIIVINDGSTDNTAEILNGFQPFITVITQENKGHSEARNVGMANAHGEYLYFIDADDYIHPQTIEILMNHLIETDADISIGNYTRHRDLNDTLNDTFTVYSSTEALEILTRDVKPIDKQQLAFTTTWNKIFKRELFDDIKFPSGHIHDDNFTAHRLLGRANKIAYTSAVLYFYTYKEHSMSNDGVYSNRDMMLAYQDRIAYLAECGLTQFLPDVYKKYKHICLSTYRRLHDYSIVEEAGLDIKKVIIYVKDATKQNGIMTWIDNLCTQLGNQYYFQVLCAKGRRYEKYDDTKKYRCHVLIHNYESDDVPANIMAERTYVVLHCDYASLPTRYSFNKDYQYIAVSDVVARGMWSTYGINCITIEGLFTQPPEKKRVYKFITAAQPINTKGIGRMHEFARLLKDNGVCFQWLIFYDKFIPYTPKFPEMIVSDAVPHDVLLQYMRDADYVVQLSDSEGFCMAVHESLMMGTPVIVTNIPIFNMVVNGYNGYRVPPDMREIDLEKILKKIPKKFEYEDKCAEIKKKWENIISPEG